MSDDFNFKDKGIKKVNNVRKSIYHTQFIFFINIR